MTCIIKRNHGQEIFHQFDNISEIFLALLFQPQKLQVTFVLNEEKEQFFKELVSFLNVLKSTSKENYWKLGQSAEDYLNRDGYNMEKILEDCFAGKSEQLSIFEAYRRLAGAKLLIHSPDTEKLLSKLIDMLPENVHELNNLRQNTVAWLKDFVEILYHLQERGQCTDVVLTLAFTEKPKHVWFINAFGHIFAASLMISMDKIVAAHMKTGSPDKIYDKFMLYANIYKRSHVKGVTNYLDTLHTYWNTLTANTNSRTVTLNIVHLLRNVSTTFNLQEHAELSRDVVTWFCNALKNPNHSLKMKHKVLKLLCLVLRLCPGSEVKEALLTMSSHNFPIFTQELTETKRELYVLTFRQVRFSRIH